MILNKNIFELHLIDEVTGDLLWVIPPQQVTGLKFSKKISNVGNLTITMFYNDTLWNLFDIDLMVDVYTLNDITDELELEETFLLRGRETYFEGNIPQMVFFGESLDGLVLRRVIYPTDNDNTNAGGFVTRAGNTGDLLEQLFDEQIINTDNPQRTFPNITTNLIDSGNTTAAFRTRLTPLIDTLKLITDKEVLMNWKFRRDTAQNIVIDIGLSNDYRYDTIYPDTGYIIFSPDYGNISDPVFKQSDQNTKTVIYVQGEGEGVNQELLQLSTPEVFQSIFSWIETTTKSTRGEKSQSSAFQQALSVGLKKIHETKREIKFNFSLLQNNGSFVYRRDFDIGDYVSFYWREQLVDFKIISTTFTANGSSVTRDFELEFEDG